MTISNNHTRQEVEARNVRFDHDMLVIELSDERQIVLPFKKIKWLDWLAAATPEQRAKWSIEPHGYAIWWEELDDGFEMIHALSLQSLPHQQSSQPIRQVVAQR